MQDIGVFLVQDLHWHYSSGHCVSSLKLTLLCHNPKILTIVHIQSCGYVHDDKKWIQQCNVAFFALDNLGRVLT